MKCECKRCGTKFDHQGGPVRCPTCGSDQFWVVGGLRGVILLVVLLAALMAAIGFLILPAQTFRAEAVALIVAIPLVSLRYWLWRKPGTR